LGEPARFPAGPFIIASLLQCPVYLVFGLFHRPNRYDLYCEPFAERVQLPRKTRQQALTTYAQKFADRLEHYCRLGPYNWFNFYDFWSSET
jgi:predicted LPLAT superfamily acyltransferase